MNNSLRPRSGSIDALRVLGITSIVAGHTWDDSSIIRLAIYTWHVPLFFFLTGYLWTAKRTLGDEIKKRSKALLIPYVVWLALLAVPFTSWLITRGELGATDLLDLIWGGNHLGRPFSAFWFVTALFAVSLMLRMLRRLPMLVIWTIAICGLGAAYLAGPALAEVPLSFGTAWPCLVFVLAGYGTAKVRPRFERPLAFAPIFLGIGALLAATGIAAPLDLKQADFGTPILSVAMSLMLCIGILLLSEGVAPMLSPATNRVMTVLALGGFMVVLTHAGILWLLSVGPNGSAAGFAAAVILPWAAALIVVRTPLAPYFLGSSPTPKQPKLSQVS